MRSAKRLAVLFTSAAVALAVPAGMAPAQAEEFSDAQRGEIGEIVRDYLLENPEVLREAFQALEEKEQAAQAEKVTDLIRENSDALFQSPLDHVAGNPDGDVTMVEFFDYNCGYCKRSLADVLALIENDPDLRFIPKEFPILGPGSVFASRAAIASRKQDKYWPFHLAMMKHRGEIDEDTVLKIAGDVGLDVEQLKTDMEAPEVKETIEQGYKLANLLGIQGTPAFVIGEQFVPGAMGREVLEGAIDAERQAGE
ncbi:DsbA family protein [Kaustia mangrovi]|uniref:DsbA family protein n=1 Tax=Kaustia mangrovi TaxID=2593653 RepID=A0A7S8HDQ6_9HYPH|nr:DsbA family protein [Kaustia mangrovi]QPC44744.1 DsbA family protein [Kaustia mangrovi]